MDEEDQEAEEPSVADASVVITKNIEQQSTVSLRSTHARIDDFEAQKKDAVDTLDSNIADEQRIHDQLLQNSEIRAAGGCPICDAR